ncbi:MAG: purine-nucleoside phosphorylase [Planctomycetota bacterium]
MTRSTIMREFRERAQAAAKALSDRVGVSPKVAMFLGTGHDELSNRLEQRTVVRVEELPGFPERTESATFVVGTYAGMPVLIADAPLAPYLGVTGHELAFPVRVFRELGVEVLVLTAAAAALRPGVKPGDLAMVEDHIDLTRMNPLLGHNDDLLGPRFPDMTEPYCPILRKLARRVAKEVHFPLHEGVFAAIQGPSLPTRAEYRFLRMAGSDFVGMSTVPEVLAAVHAGLRNLALLGITQVLDVDDPRPTDLETIVEASDLAAPRMAALLSGLLEQLSAATA